MTKRILVPIAAGVEEMEAITIIDIMVRAGYKVFVASAQFDASLTMRASRGITLTADYHLIDVADDEFDAVVLPGGLGGAETFRDSELLIEIIREQQFDGKLVAAICASPALVLNHHHLYPEAKMTCHPGFKEQIPAQQWSATRVTYDQQHNLLTSQGPGTSLEFAMEIIKLLSGKEHAWKVAEPMVTMPSLNYDYIGN